MPNRLAQKAVPLGLKIALTTLELFVQSPEVLRAALARPTAERRASTPESFMLNALNSKQGCRKTKGESEMEETRLETG